MAIQIVDDLGLTDFIDDNHVTFFLDDVGNYLGLLGEGGSQQLFDAVGFHIIDKVRMTAY
jgi:hypothetical protein